MVETKMLKATGEVNTVKRDQFIAREVSTMKRWRSKGQAGAKRYADFAAWSDADIANAAEAQARIYSDQFRVFA